MPSTPDKRQSLLQLAISLRLAAQRLADSASRIQQAASQQRQYLAKLAELRQRVNCANGSPNSSSCVAASARREREPPPSHPVDRSRLTARQS